jgi:regulatory protein
MKTNALQTSVKLLSKKAYSISKLKASLKKKSFTDEEINSAIEKLEQKNYINDQRYTENRAVCLLRKNYGDIYILSKLETEGLTITSEDLLLLRQEYEIEESIVLKQAIEDKTRRLTSDELKRKMPQIIRYFVSRGFSPDHVTNELGVDDVSWN